jgi:hypothetical protein
MSTNTKSYKSYIKPIFYSNEDRTNDTSCGLAAMATLILAVLVPYANSNFALVLALFWCYPAFGPT